jgi:phage-related protein
MEISIADWKAAVNYGVDDIVRVPYFYKMNQDAYKEITLNTEKEIFFEKLKINKKIGYEASVSVKKYTEGTILKDEYMTHLNSVQNSGLYQIDKSSSIGLGVGFVFYDIDENQITVKEPRKFLRASAGSEFNDYEYKKIHIDIEEQDIPSGAEYIGIFIFSYGIKKGGFKFIEAKLSPANHFFYCTKDHESGTSDKFSDFIKTSEDYWTQDFLWRPSYSSRASFLSKNIAMEMGDGNDHTSAGGLNSLPIQLELRFDNRTDKQTKAILHFLQEKHFAYESMFSLDYKGDRLKSNEVRHFKFKYTFPYKELHFTCTDFVHNIKYRNNNEVSATFICNNVSTVSSVEGGAGYNEKEDAVFPCGINGRKFFAKNKETRLDTFALPTNQDGVIPNDLERVSKQFEGVFIKENDSFLGEIGFMSENFVDNKNKNIENKGLHIDEEIAGRLTTDMQWWNFSINLKFKDDKPQNLKAGDWIYLSSNLMTESIFSVGITKIRKVISSTEFVTDGVRYEGFEGLDFSDIIVENNGYKGELPDVTYTRLERHPDDCLSSKISFPQGKNVLSSMVRNKTTGEISKRKIISRDYRIFYLERDVHAGDTSIYLSSENEYSVVGPIGFDILVPMVRGKSSMYIDDPDSVLEYPWNKLRNFDYMPTMAFTISNTPDHIQTEFTKYYNKKYKKSINSNLAQINVTFEQRSDEEARAILLFLESHLGYKKFSLDLPRPYLGGSDNNIPEEIVGSHIFYCPSWSHEIVYKNNHKITATFFESKTGQAYENTFNDDCKVGGTITDIVTKHNICTYSSSASAYGQSGLKVDYDIAGNPKYIFEPKGKEVDIVFVIDGGPSLSGEKLFVGNRGYSKYELFIDSIIKMVVGYDGNKYPGTYPLSGAERQSISINPNQSGSQSEPPWYAYENRNRYEEPIDQIRSWIYGNADRSDGVYEYDISLGKILNIDLTNTSGYDLSQFKRFNIEIEERRVNLGISIVGNIVMSEYPMDRLEIPNDYDSVDYLHKRILDLPDFPRSFDKIEIWRALTKHIRDVTSNGYNNALGRNHAYALQDAMAQLYNSPRANIVDERYIIYISDFFFDRIDKSIIQDITRDIKTGGPLAKRRPRDIVLKDYEIDKSMQRYAYSKSWRSEGEAVYSNLINPDFSKGGTYSSVNYINYLRRVYLEEDVNRTDVEALRMAQDEYNAIAEEDKVNPDWYDKDIKTTFIPVAAGVSGEVDVDFNTYAADYDSSKENNNLQYIYTTNTDGDPREEAFRIFNLNDVVKNIAKDSGAQNLFSITVSNCGPHPIKLKNTIISFESESGQAKWTRDIIESGIVRDNDTDNIQHIPAVNNKLNPLIGTGGQYYNDDQNERILDKKKSNVIWHNFNTRYEVYRKGEIHEVDGGWGQKVFQNRELAPGMVYSDTSYGQSELHVDASRGDQYIYITKFKLDKGGTTLPVYGYFQPGNKITISGDEYIIKRLDEEDILSECRYLINGMCIGRYNAAVKLHLSGLLRKDYKKADLVLESSPVKDLLLDENGEAIEFGESGISMDDLRTARNLQDIQEEGLDISSLSVDTRTMGVKNEGIAFKGMPIRVFNSESTPLEIIDYNVGGIDIDDENSFGNYDHIPVLQRGESIDLFFGFRCNDVQVYKEKIQLLINSEQLNEQNPSDIYLDCYAKTEIELSINKSRVLSTITGGGEEEDYDDSEDKSKNDNDLVAAQAPIIEQIVPASDGLCDPYGFIEPLINNFSKMHLSEDFPAWTVLWEALYGDWESGYEDDPFLIFDHYQPWGKYHKLHKGDLPEWVHGGKLYKTVLDKLGAVGGLFKGSSTGGNGKIGDRITEPKDWDLSDPKYNTKGYAKYLAIKPDFIYDNRRHEMGGFPIWWSEFLEGLEGQGNHRSPWEVRYTYGTIRRLGGTHSYNWTGIPYNKISNLQQFFDCMMMELVFWQMMMQGGIPWPNGVKYYGNSKAANQVAGPNVWLGNLNSDQHNKRGWPLRRTEKRCRYRVYGACCGAYDVNWFYRVKFYYKHSIFNWVMERGWGTGNICPGGPNHENSIFYKQNKPAILRNVEYKDGSVYISSKSVMSEKDKIKGDHFWASEPGDIGLNPEHKFFGPWATIHNLDRSNPSGTNIAQELLCRRFYDACKFAKSKVPYEHIKSIVVNAPIRVTIYGPRRPEDCNCGAKLESKTLAESQDLYRNANVIFDGIGPFVLNSLNSLDGFEDWFHSKYESSIQNEEYWYSNFKIRSGKQFLGCYGLEDATRISVFWLGEEYVDFNRTENDYTIKKLPNDFCYNSEGEQVPCYKVTEIKNASQNEGTKIINELKRGSVIRSEVNFEAGEVQYGKTYGNDFTINNKIYPNGIVPVPKLTIEELDAIEKRKQEEIEYLGDQVPGGSFFSLGTAAHVVQETNVACQDLIGSLFAGIEEGQEITGSMWLDIVAALNTYKDNINQNDKAISIMYEAPFNRSQSSYNAKDFHQEFLTQIQLISEQNEDNKERVNVGYNQATISEEVLDSEGEVTTKQHDNILYHIVKKLEENASKLSEDPDTDVTGGFCIE